MQCFMLWSFLVFLFLFFWLKTTSFQSHNNLMKVADQITNPAVIYNWGELLLLKVIATTKQQNNKQPKYNAKRINDNQQQTINTNKTKTVCYGYGIERI